MMVLFQQTLRVDYKQTVSVVGTVTEKHIPVILIAL